MKEEAFVIPVVPLSFQAFFVSTFYVVQPYFSFKMKFISALVFYLLLRSSQTS